MTTRISEGAALLAQAGSIADTAKATGYTTRSISGYRSGRRTPDLAHRQHIQRVYPQIDQQAWDRMPKVPEPHAAPVAPPTSPPSASSPATAEAERQTAETRLREQMARLKAQRAVGDLTPSAAVALERLELGASAALAKLEGAHLTEAQIMGSPLVARFVDALIAALDQHPLAFFEALNAVNVLQDIAPTFHIEEAERAHPVEVKAVRDADAALLAVMKARAGKRAA